MIASILCRVVVGRCRRRAAQSLHSLVEAFVSCQTLCRLVVGSHKLIMDFAKIIFISYSLNIATLLITKLLGSDYW